MAGSQSLWADHFQPEYSSVERNTSEPVCSKVPVPGGSVVLAAGVLGNYISFPHIGRKCFRLTVVDIPTRPRLHRGNVTGGFDARSAASRLITHIT
jgi:hypothetical protein